MAYEEKYKRFVLAFEEKIMSDLLELIKKGTSISTVELAAKTGSTPEMVTARLERYEALHIIKRVVLNTEGCSGHCGHKQCAGCSHNPANQPQIVMWELV